MPEADRAGDERCGAAVEEGQAVEVPWPRCGRATVWVLREGGTFHAVEERRADCDCALTDDEWLDLGGVAAARLAEVVG